MKRLATGLPQQMALALVTLLFAISSSRAAGTPDASQSTVSGPSEILLVIPGANGHDAVDVVVRDSAGDPVPDAMVVIDLSGCSDLCIDSPDDGLSGTTDSQGHLARGEPRPRRERNREPGGPGHDVSGTRRRGRFRVRRGGPYRSRWTLPVGRQSALRASGPTEPRGIRGFGSPRLGRVLPSRLVVVGRRREEDHPFPMKGARVGRVDAISRSAWPAPHRQGRLLGWPRKATPTRGRASIPIVRGLRPVFPGHVDMSTPEGCPEWSRELVALCGRIGPRPAVDDRNRAWRIVYFNLARYLRYHAARLGRVDPDDIDDIASQKTMDLMTQVEDQQGSLRTIEPGKVSAFLSTVARNGLITFLKRRHRSVAIADEDEVHPAAVERPEMADSSEAGAESREYAQALAMCAESLDPRTRRAWFFRAFYGMSSRDIATHPDVDLSVNQVDVRLHRGRRVVRGCMESRGHDTRTMPPGTFIELWQGLSLQLAPVPEAT